MPAVQSRFEEVGGHRLPLGGVNGYAHVRAKQGKKRNKFQGISPGKKTLTGHFDTALEAAVAYAQKKEDQQLGLAAPGGSQKKKPPASNSSSTKLEVGTYLGHLLRQPRPVIPTVAAAPLSAQQAADAVARGVPVAYAQLLA